ncbi:DUF427 domain-containing protein [Sphingomonas sp. MMSM20]|uniref:DUF427 domain-containing protein n=1 Tax=Sphingomonas lycopersici TaxID=2951807 RepID=UPI0022380173|nr:DUF427 domain-containing protein [Sphingomonas lycopersici]MCW6528923.1 DUF427 domain-containing protein [Sphingomonas lycopersici]
MTDPHFTIEPSAKRVRATIGDIVLADSIATWLLIEGYAPVYYFPRDDVRTDLLRSSGRRTDSAGRGTADWWSVETPASVRDDVAWCFAQPEPDAELLADHIAFDWDKIDHWFEEDEEIFGHPRDPHHRVDVRASSRRVDVSLAGETIASTTHGLFLFETGLPPRCYIPPEDVRSDLLSPSPTTSICPYKGNASYWHLRIGQHVIEDAVWSYRDPLPECPRIRNYYCFYDEKVDRIEVERPTPLTPGPAAGRH